MPLMQHSITDSGELNRLSGRFASVQLIDAGRVNRVRAAGNSVSASSSVVGGDYNDYDEVTIPPNLTDLLANLPDDISSDSIQKMLRDSVDNPKALLAEFGKLMASKKAKNDSSHKYRSRNLRELKPGDFRSGEKIDQIEVDWTSTRRRDVPSIPELDGSNKYEKPMIAGQLLIFDLDEEPPSDTLKTPTSTRKSTSSECSISKDGLLAMFAGFGALCSALLAVIGFLIIRLKSQSSPMGDTTPISKQFQYAQKRFFESSS
uniref:Uncharacterized protein n=1 Tax=Caenorhabditis japonica TaxID=281687 RepID=A0A8R1ERC1_CAEJA